MSARAAAITVDVLAPHAAEEYERFLLTRRGSLVYQTIRFRDFLKELLQCGERYLVATVDGEIRGALPLLYADGPAGRVYNSLPYYGSNGGVMADREEVAHELTGAYSEIVHERGTLASTIVANPFDDSPFVVPPHKLQDVRISQATELPASSGDAEAAIYAVVESSARRNVAKARKEGIVVEADAAAVGELQAMHVAGMEAIGGLAKTPRFFELLGKHFRPGTDYDIYVARRDGKALAALLVFYFNRTVEYYTPASDPDARALQPLSVVLVQAMTDAAARGFTSWNWGGTWQSQGGVYQFKKKWGAREENYLYYTELNDESILNRPASEIVGMYPGFFVVPFAALRASNA